MQNKRGKKRSARTLTSNIKRNLLKSRCSQEEMVGFVLIIILVSIIVLVFLAISIRKPQEIKQNKEIQNFLHSSLLYTTSCYESAGIVYNLKDLIKACYDNNKCMDDRDSCDVLSLEYKEVIDNSWNIGEKSIEKAYLLKVYDEANETLAHLSEGNKTGTKKEGSIPLYVEGNNIYVDMQIFY